MYIGWDCLTAGLAYLSSQYSAITLSAGWNRYSCTFTIATATTGLLNPIIRTRAVAQAVDINADGMQVEQKPYPTPTIHTDGATAIRNTGRITAPASLVTGGTFWFAALVRLGFAAADDEYGGAAAGPHLFNYGAADTNGYYKTFFREGDNSWYARIGAGAASESSSLVSTHAKGDVQLIFSAFRPGQNRLSINGAPFSTAVSTLLPTPTDTTLDIGSGGSSFGSQINSEILWSALGTGNPTDADAAVLYARLRLRPLPRHQADVAGWLL